jgi:hypothetical protein
MWRFHVHEKVGEKIELIVVYSIHPRIVKKKDSLEFTVEGYKNINKVVLYTWKTFLDWF